MSKIIPKNDKEVKQKANRRRRKKRRTEDFSDSSDSSSSSSSESEDEEKDDEEQQKEANIDEEGDLAVLSDSEITPIIENKKAEEDFKNIKNKLKTVELTKTPLNYSSKNINLNQVESLINQGNKQLENDYLGLMFENYGDDIDEVRKAPDFNERSLTILANVLKNGSNIFDEETLRAVVGK
ncbi:hypothetical protein BN7_4031 [Wickerhamomyces ciferrii]|uniref:Ribosome assembly protein 3 n=1 Tax=Wickerhamomyces ciferrii (strain ATCC 14091 / BCRC 22168 / CBS 111 / JCM 3599 / NBRC 0793 / NRRL Y-1031 F-60-10) TaxID=1206466 RepID=K0KQP9_WICCF|nr:uncharacterized protein BN7_4031 [Wickerhamomyces ciferrii]CCH44467.1 hypothetical protein BN7_4031 [Wickerhamomyces ciferrii]